MTAGLATAAIGNGLAFVVLVYATAGISGGHLNPAISTAFVVTGRWRCLAPTPHPPVCCGACLRTRVSAAPARPPCADGGAARNRLGKQRYACYCAAQVMGAIFGALALKLALPPAMDETPFTTTGSLTFSHPFQVRDERRRALPAACAWVCVHSQLTRARAPGFLPGVCLHIYAGVLRFRHCRGQIGR